VRIELEILESRAKPSKITTFVYNDEAAAWGACYDRQMMELVVA
jgi:hypothetical protein